MKTLYNIDVNPGLLWDHYFSPEEYMTENFFAFYLARVLESGTVSEVRTISPAIIAQYLARLNLSGRVRKFWEWYLSPQKDHRGNSHSIPDRSS